MTATASRTWSGQAENLAEESLWPGLRDEGDQGAAMGAEILKMRGHHWVFNDIKGFLLIFISLIIVWSCFQESSYLLDILTEVLTEETICYLEFALKSSSSRG